jgi:hypothetical protein
MIDHLGVGLHRRDVPPPPRYSTSGSLMTAASCPGLFVLVIIIGRRGGAVDDPER